MRLRAQETQPMLRVTGRRVGQRFEIIVSDRQVLLSGTGFYYLFRLAHHAVTKPGEYLSLNGSDAGNNHIRYIYRLRCELKANETDGQLRIINDKGSGYRLLLEPPQVAFGLQSLAEFPDVRIREMSKELQNHRAFDRRLESTVR